MQRPHQHLNATQQLLLHPQRLCISLRLVPAVLLGLLGLQLMQHLLTSATAQLLTQHLAKMLTQHLLTSAATAAAPVQMLTQQRIKMLSQ
jgi:hypothetical protein